MKSTNLWEANAEDRGLCLQMRPKLFGNCVGGGRVTHLGSSAGDFPNIPHCIWGLRMLVLTIYLVFFIRHLLPDATPSFLVQKW